MDQFWPDLQLPKAKIKMGKIICFYVNTHVLKSEPGYSVTFSHGYCTLCYDKFPSVLHNLT